MHGRNPFNFLFNTAPGSVRPSQSNNNYTAVIKRDAGWWTGWIVEIPGVMCQAATREDLIESLQLMLREVLAENRSAAIRAAGMNFEELEIAV